jgi:hypothetical protein
MFEPLNRQEDPLLLWGRSLNSILPPSILFVATHSRQAPPPRTLPSHRRDRRGLKDLELRMHLEVQDYASAAAVYAEKGDLGRAVDMYLKGGGCTRHHHALMHLRYISHLHLSFL